jgi:hemerythrin-like domain-containing protein
MVMKAASSSPADTQMMGIVHSALRRDLDRAEDILSRPTPPRDSQRMAIAQHLHAMMDFLHVHHVGEDDWLWPTIRRLNPAASEVLDQMDADHLSIAPHMAKVKAAADAYNISGSGRESLVHALADLRDSLDPHLRREEDDMMPIVASTLTGQQWDSWEKDYYVKPKTKSELGLEGHWLIDGVDRARYDHVVGKVNPVLRLVLLRFYGPKYRQACATRWGDDVAVGPKLG